MNILSYFHDVIQSRHNNYNSMQIVKYILLFVSLIINTSVLSQEDNTATDTPEKDIPAKIELIPVLELTSRLPDATNKIKSIEQSLITDKIIKEEIIKLDTFLLNFKQFKQKHIHKGEELEDLNLLQNELYNWEKEKAKLYDVQQSFDNIKNELIEQKESLQTIKTLWEKSLEAAKGNDLPNNAKRMVNSLLKDIERINRTLNEKNDLVYKQLESIANTTIYINDQIQTIETKLSSLTETLILNKEPSLFHKLFKKDNDSNNQKKYVPKDFYTPISNYVSDNLIIITIHIIFFLLIFVLLNVLKRKIKPAKYKDLDAKLIYIVFEFLHRPLISALLIFLLSASFIYTDPPPVFTTLIYFLLLIPVMIILPVITIKEFNFFIYGLGLIYLLTLFLRLHILNSITGYLIILGAILMTVWGIGKFLHKSIINKIFKRDITRMIMSFLFYGFAILLIISFFSILIGYYTLGLFLFDSTIWSIYRVFLFYASVAVLAGFTELLLYSDYVRQINSIKKNSKEILSWLHSFILLMMTLILFKEMFSLFGIYELIADFLVSLWDYAIPLGAIDDFTIGNILTLFITIWLSSLISKIISSVLEQDVLKKFKLKRGVPRTISILAKYTILTVGFLIAIAAAGMELSNFTIILGALGVGIGFGLQDVINNFISGLILLFERPIQTGDTIQVGELWGKVKNIGIRSSIIRSFDGSEVIVPNGMLISREVTNWTLSDQKRRLDILIGVEYGTDLKQVLSILIDCANKHDSVMDDPAPSAWFLGFGDSSINFKLVFWHPSFDGSLSVKSEVAIEVFDALKKANITIPFPQQDVYIKEFKPQKDNSVTNKNIKEKKDTQTTKKAIDPKVGKGDKSNK